ncbi:MAG: hypothetical protein IPM92_14285 [Saprospiraceae bacterium]|nr:hypothetical protein [Saprospiraceae bacterium]
MKKINFNWMFIWLACTIWNMPAFSQSSGTDSTGLPGDHFSLQGALEMFKQSSSPEDFEKRINTEDNKVNNLDLNGDGDIDYVKVISKVDGDVHVFILQVPVSENENQDIAVIELEKDGKESAILQIIGDDDIYGEQVIVEPQEEITSPEKEGGDEMKGGGPNPFYDMDEEMAIVINVWPWPCVRFVYAPAYRPWISPWRWRHYPGWWRPWRPFSWHVWHPFHHRYHRHYPVVRTHRVVHAHRVYTPHRTASVTVKTRHATNLGKYRVTRTKTTKTVTGPRGNTKVKTTKTTRVKRR